MTNTDSQKNTLAMRWHEYSPSKKLWIWSMVGASVVTMALGFTAGGWTTSGRASVMADRAAREATSKLVASVCVQRFASSADAAKNLNDLKKTYSWQRGDFIEKGGWVALVGVENSVPGAANLCADRLIEMKDLPTVSADASAS
jgi:hypothetical protein